MQDNPPSFLQAWISIWDLPSEWHRNRGILCTHKSILSMIWHTFILSMIWHAFYVGDDYDSILCHLIYERSLSYCALYIHTYVCVFMYSHMLFQEWRVSSILPSHSTDTFSSALDSESSGLMYEFVYISCSRDHVGSQALIELKHPV